MNLNQPITLETLKALPFFKHVPALVVCVISLLTVILFATKSYALYVNSQDFDQKNLEFIEINNQINSTHKRISKLLAKEALYFNDLNSAPATKSELVDLLSNIGASSKLTVKKLIANDGTKDQQKEDIIEMELEGNYSAINEFINRVNPLLSACNILSFKLDKRKESHFIHAAISIKFSKPPVLMNKPSSLKANLEGLHSYVDASQSINYDYSRLEFANNNLSKLGPAVAFSLNGEDYYYGAPQGDWGFYNVGFVQQPIENKAQADLGQDNKKDITSNVNDDLTNKRQDPFLPSPKSNLNGAQGSLDAVSGTFLSGIIYAERLGLCIVTLPSGESKVFAEGEYINAKSRIRSIKPDHVYVQSKIDKLYKVGQEIYAK